VSRRLRPEGPQRQRRCTGAGGEAICRPDERDEFLSSENVMILESWNVNTDPELSIARARLTPGQGTEAHCLEGITERYLIASGVGRVFVGSLPPEDIRPGDVVFIPPGVSQRLVNTGSEDLVFYCLCTPAFDQANYRRLEPASGDASGE